MPRRLPARPGPAPGRPGGRPYSSPLACKDRERRIAKSNQSPGQTQGKRTTAAMIRAEPVWQAMDGASCISSEDESWLDQGQFQLSDDEHDEVHSLTAQAYVQAVAHLKVKRVWKFVAETSVFLRLEHFDLDVLSCRRELVCRAGTGHVLMFGNLFSWRCICSFLHAAVIVCSAVEVSYALPLL